MSEDRPSGADAVVFRLMYRSRDQLPAQERPDELGDLFTTSRSNNNKRNITGALLLSGHWFVQVLEGPERDVRSLYATIAKDPRHDRVETVSEVHAPERAFARWSMAEVTVPDSEIPLIAQVGEISADSHTMTPAQQQVVAEMRAALADAPDA
ncbi:MAG TPA: BLUF domain-containing protein [Dermatophilaceae bacterium]|nr:BLUF domain-containing protein [Dermatophilaceae bacterium]